MKRIPLQPLLICALLLALTAACGAAPPAPAISQSLSQGTLTVDVRRDEVIERNRATYVTFRLLESGTPVRGGEVLVTPMHAEKGPSLQRIALEGPNGYYGAKLSFPYTGTYTLAVEIRTPVAPYAFTYGPIEVQPRVRRGIFDYR